MTDSERIAELESRVAALEAMHNRLGPNPEQDAVADEKQREKLVDKFLAKVDGTSVAIPSTPSDCLAACLTYDVDRSARVLTDGSPVTEDHRDIIPETGQQKGYVVLSSEERTKGFVRPVRRTYLHKTCGETTTMSIEIAETYARDPKFYSGTFCCKCRAHFPLDQFVWAGTWEGTDVQVGS